MRTHPGEKSMLVLRPLVVVLVGLSVLFVGATLASQQFTDFLKDQRADTSERFGDLPGRYDRALEVGYMKGCMDEVGDLDYCRCTLRKLTKAYSQKRFVEIDAQLRKDPSAVPPRMASMFQACLSR